VTDFNKSDDQSEQATGSQDSVTGDRSNLRGVFAILSDPSTATKRDSDALIDRQLDEWITEHEAEIVEQAQALIRIPSVLGEPEDGAPYGVETRRALDFVVDLTQRYGLTTKMLDGHAMHAEFGEGDYLIGVLSHVDVVPAGQDWTYPPFGGDVAHGKLFGRGAIDDKGPAIASLYAMFAVKQTGVQINSRVRAIIGADEETGFRCVAHYFEREEMPDVGFTPDGSFPVIYAEKGIAGPRLQSAIPETADQIKLRELSGGERSNMVPDRAYATLTGAGVPWDTVASKIVRENITTSMDGDELHITAVGLSAHASYPHKGVNAVAMLVGALIDANVVPGLNQWLETVHALASDTTGAILGIAGNDEVCGDLTCNLGVAQTIDNELQVTFSIRYPVTWKGSDVKAKVLEAAIGLGYSLTRWEDSPPLYVPADDVLVETLMNVYRAETGDIQPPKTMGGGTYARALAKGVAFGPDFPGSPEIAHKADEFWRVDELILATRIYAKAIARLACRS
jgi:succinyl-diaminopimelate desuccinylase